MKEFLLVMLWPIFPLSLLGVTIATGILVLLIPKYFGIRLPWTKG